MDADILLYHLCEVLERIKGNRGVKDCNPYALPEVREALKYIAEVQGFSNYLDAVTDKGGLR